MEEEALYAIGLAASAGVVLLVAFAVGRAWPFVSKAALRPDGLAYTTLAGAAVGCLFMCNFPHTVGHGAFRAFGWAGLLSAEAAFTAGMLGRGVAGAVFRGKREAVGRWVGNVLAFLTPLLTVPPLALS
ncbi:MAG: hypothetical protein ACYS9X_20185 [Planctomycetota bacterium]